MKFHLITVFFLILLSLTSLDIKAMVWLPKKKHLRAIQVKVVSEEGCPIKVVLAEVRDLGTKLSKIKEVENTYTTKIENISDKKILSYQLLWSMHLPFEPYASQNFKVNSIEALDPKQIETIAFRRPIHYRHDAYYHMWVSRVLFEDETMWESEQDEYTGEWAKLKEEINDL